MRFVRLATLLLLATIIVAEPVIHTHPLQQAVTDDGSIGLSTSAVCAICAVSAGQILPKLPVVTVRVVTARVVEVVIDCESADRTAPGTSRAPPSA
jgi:hypothetical protein